MANNYGAARTEDIDGLENLEPSSNAAIPSMVVTFFKLLALADAVKVDGTTLTRWDTEEPIGDPDNEVVRFSWVNDEGLSFACTLCERGIVQGEWRGDIFFCNDSEGYSTKITLYKYNVLTPASMS